MKKLGLALLLLTFFNSIAFSQSGYEITIDIDGYDEDEMFLAYYLGDKEYILDTVQVNDKGQFVFEGEEPLACGVYLGVLKPDNSFFQLMVTQGHQHFTMTSDMDALIEKASFKKSEDNNAFYDYLRFLEEKRPMADATHKKMEATTDQTEKDAYQKQLDQLDKEVGAFQNKILKNFPNTLTAKLIKANLQLDVPEYEGLEGDDLQEAKWRYSQKHFFDNIDLSDPCALRTPYLFQRVDYFIDKMNVQHPDTVADAVVQLLEKMRPSPETFKFYLIHYLNKFAASKFIGMDAAYVRLVDKYYAKGEAPWTDEEQLEKILDNAQKLKPLLIGKTAPDIRLTKRDGSTFTLHEIESPYTVLYFWRYDCGHCKKSTPFMDEFYKKYKDKGVVLVGVCAKLMDEVDGCWKYVDEKEINDWLHGVDKYHRSKFMTKYDLKSTPQIYILDKDKTIISKRIGAEQLDEVMEKIMEQDMKEESKSE